MPGKFLPQAVWTVNYLWNRPNADVASKPTNKGGKFGPVFSNSSPNFQVTGITPGGWGVYINDNKMLFEATAKTTIGSTDGFQTIFAPFGFGEYVNGSKLPNYTYALQNAQIKVLDKYPGGTDAITRPLFGPKTITLKANPLYAHNAGNTVKALSRWAFGIQLYDMGERYWSAVEILGDYEDAPGGEKKRLQLYWLAQRAVGFYPRAAIGADSNALKVRPGKCSGWWAS